MTSVINLAPSFGPDGTVRTRWKRVVAGSGSIAAPLDRECDTR